ncbi:uncharacterized protein LOC107326412, partial [Python bivittatus]|uniref:Uncharacterized protein LOC107326412 n=1 Tax=Python bivittatus TaxID=176946 RepID=A0A9F5IQ24_PYTBI
MRGRGVTTTARTGRVLRLTVVSARRFFSRPLPSRVHDNRRRSRRGRSDPAHSAQPEAQHQWATPPPFPPTCPFGAWLPVLCFGAMRRTGRPRRGGGKESPPLNPASGGGNSRGRRAPPSPPRLPPQEEKQQGRSGDREPERSASQDAVSEPSAAVFLLRGLQQSLGRNLPGGASPHAMKRGGPGRKGAKSDYQRQEKRDHLAHEFGEWQDWLRDVLRETGVFITRTDSKIWLTLIMAAVAGILH